MLRARLADDHLVVPEETAVDGWIHRVEAEGASEEDLKTLIASESERAAAQIDPAEGAMARFVWLDAGQQAQGRLVVLINHLVVDAVSWRLLLPDLAEAGAAVAAGQPVELQPVPVSYRHWARDLAAQATSPERLAELPDWIGMAEGREWSFIRAGSTGPGEHRASAQVGPEVTGALLTSVPAAFHAGVEDVLLTGLAAAVAERFQVRDGLLVGLEGHGREAGGLDLSRTAGWFTNGHPVRLDVGAVDHRELRAGGAAAERAVKRVKEQLREIPGDRLGYGLLRYLNPDTASKLAALPTPKVGFNYLGRVGGGPAPSAETGPKDWQAVSEGGGVAGDQTPMMHPVEVISLVREHADGPRLSLMMSWAPGTLTDDEARDLLDGWAAALAGLAAYTGGGYTPSDFPMVDLSQDELDELEAMAKQIEEGA
jgi:mycobactin peptide synthetase MbtF